MHLTGLSTEAKFFTSSYSKLRNNLLGFLRSCPNLAQFKAQMANLLDVPHLINLKQTNIRLEEV